MSTTDHLPGSTSCEHANRKIIRMLVRALPRTSIRVWIDQIELKSNTLNPEQALRAAIHDACSFQKSVLLKPLLKCPHST
jgi:hypothetical protein